MSIVKNIFKALPALGVVVAFVWVSLEKSNDPPSGPYVKCSDWSLPTDLKEIGSVRIAAGDKLVMLSNATQRLEVSGKSSVLSIPDDVLVAFRLTDHGGISIRNNGRASGLVITFPDAAANTCHAELDPTELVYTGERLKGAQVVAIHVPK